MKRCWDSMKSAIVTGANGFIGKAVCKKLLANGIRTCAIVRDPQTMKDISEDDNLIVIQGDITDIKIGSYK